MTRFRDFDAARAEADPLTFRLAGRDFATVPVIPAGALLDMARASMGGNDAMSFAAFSAFFDAVIPAEQADEFKAAILEVDLGTIIELLGWIVEEATGRPLTNRSPSHKSPSEGGQQSNNVSEIRSA